jgi:hypothetical protein
MHLLSTAATAAALGCTSAAATWRCGAASLHASQLLSIRSTCLPAVCICCPLLLLHLLLLLLH